jgi:hypothetical protein
MAEGANKARNGRIEEEDMFGSEIVVSNSSTADLSHQIDRLKKTKEYFIDLFKYAEKLFSKEARR